MSKVGYIQRYLLIIRHIRSHRYISMEELCACVENDLGLYDDSESIGTSSRTIKRDLQEIRKYLGISIDYSKANNGYYIPEDEDQQSDLERVLEPFDLLSSLYAENMLPGFVFPEKRQHKGTEHLYPLIHAIKRSCIVEILYAKFDDTAPQLRVVEPYGLKEYHGRWYLLAKEVHGRIEEAGEIKTWGLDRISHITISSDRFPRDRDVDVETEYQNCIGIYSDKDKPVEEVILSFPPMGGRYHVAHPLHESQEVILANDQEYRIRLQVRITYDFMMELLSQTQDVTVLAPQHLKNELICIYEQAIQRMVGQNRG